MSGPDSWEDGYDIFLWGVQQTIKAVFLVLAICVAYDILEPKLDLRAYKDVDGTVYSWKVDAVPKAAESACISHVDDEGMVWWDVDCDGQADMIERLR